MIDYRHPKRNVVIKLNKGDEINLTTLAVTRAVRIGRVEVEWTPRQYKS